MFTKKFRCFCLYAGVVLGLILYSHSLAIAQTPQETPAKYQAIQLNDTQSSISLNGNAYVLKETDTPLSIQAVEDMVQSGILATQMATSPYINIGHQNKGTWIVFPILNKSKREIWSLHLGGLKDGRFSALKEIMLYNMSTSEYLVNTKNLSERNKNIGKSLTLKIPTNTTNFFILYVKPNLTTPNYLKMELTDSNQFNSSESFISWIPILLLFCGFILSLKSAKDNQSISDIFLSLIWGVSFISLAVNSEFLYFSYFDIEILYPVIWIIISQGLMISFISIKDSRQELPISFLAGICSAVLIINLVGIITLKSMPLIASYLIFVPIISIFLAIMGVTWTTSLSVNRQSYMQIAKISFFFLVLILSLFFLDLEAISPLPFLKAIPMFIINIMAFISIMSFIPQTRTKKTFIDTPINIFETNKIDKKEASLILEAKEKSEHHRLMQVIEQERKLMSDLQVKTAQQNEDMRKAKEAADEANRAKSAFLAVVSHEIRTPMTGIMGMLSLLQDTQLNKDQKEYTSTIKDSGDAMLALLNDILDFEKIESGKMNLETINFDLKRLFRSIYTLMRGHAEAKGVQLVLEIDPNVPNWVYGDPTRLRQVLLNLINNGIKFTNKGSVYIRVRDLTGESQDTSNKIHQIYFAVQDSGIGIGANNQKNLFMPFAQADSTISRKYGGTGLGLAICKRLIEAMGGAISISSKEGEGSTFFFTISMQEGSETQDNNSTNETLYSEASKNQKVQLTSSLSVLVVDDNGINQKVVAGFVEKLGGKSMTAGTGADALDLHARYTFDVILLDIELPDMNGIEVTKIIRGLSIPSKSNIPIIAFTGNTQSEDIKSYLNAGMNDFLGKPISFEQISEVLSKVENKFYSPSRNKEVVIDFIEANDHEIDENENSSPLARYTATLNEQKNPFDFEGRTNLNFIEEDSFEAAVKQFEKMDSLDSTLPTGSKNYEALSDSGLDENILKSLRSGLSVEQIQEILISFYEKADELIAAIGNAYIEENAIALNARSHELKGMAGNFGFSELSRMCSIIEKAGRENNLGMAQDLVQGLGEHYAIARGNLNKWLNQA